MNYVLRTQQPEGCWWGRWGVNYIYGTWQAVNGLTAAYRPLCTTPSPGPTGGAGRVFEAGGGSGASVAS